MYETAVTAKRSSETIEKQEAKEKPEVNAKIVILNILKFVVGAAGIVLGADLLVENA